MRLRMERISSEFLDEKTQRLRLLVLYISFCLWTEWERIPEVELPKGNKSVKSKLDLIVTAEQKIESDFFVVSEEQQIPAGFLFE